MAKRPAIFIHQEMVSSKLYSFEWFSGFAVSQKQKSVQSLHDAILNTDQCKSLRDQHKEQRGAWHPAERIPSQAKRQYP